MTFAVAVVVILNSLLQNISCRQAKKFPSHCFFWYFVVFDAKHFSAIRGRRHSNFPHSKEVQRVESRPRSCMIGSNPNPCILIYRRLQLLLCFAIKLTGFKRFSGKSCQSGSEQTQYNFKLLKFSLLPYNCFPNQCGFCLLFKTAWWLQALALQIDCSRLPLRCEHRNQNEVSCG